MWKIEEEDEDFLVNDEFAKSIAEMSKASGRSTPGSKAKKSPSRVKAFRPVHWDEPMYNPPIGNTHMSYEFDAQFSEMEKHWKKGGTKFSDEPRVPKVSAANS